jgi:DNA-binding transcriptional MerR regulator
MSLEQVKDIIKLLNSKNPTAFSLGLAFLVAIVTTFSALVVMKADAYVATLETKADHQADLNSKIEELKKDFRIAILENNQVLIKEIRQQRRGG